MADLPPGYTLARPDASDARVIQTLVNACESADCGEQREDDWEVASDLLDPAVDIARDWFLVRAPQGEPAGVGSAYCPPGAEPWTLAYVHPLHRGRLLSAVLLELAEQRVREHLAERATGQDDRVDPKTSTVLTICEDTKTQRIAWLCARRYRRVRDSCAMRIDLSRGFAGSECPAGFELRQARLPADERASYEADLEAFVEHFGYYEQSFEAWKARHETHPEFDPALWLIAWSGSEIAGQVAGGRRGPAAYIDDVAVRKPWR